MSTHAPGLRSLRALLPLASRLRLRDEHAGVSTQTLPLHARERTSPLSMQTPLLPTCKIAARWQQQQRHLAIADGGRVLPSSLTRVEQAACAANLSSARRIFCQPSAMAKATAEHSRRSVSMKRMAAESGQQWQPRLARGRQQKELA